MSVSQNPQLHALLIAAQEDHIRSPSDWSLIRLIQSSHLHVESPWKTLWWDSAPETTRFTSVPVGLIIGISGLDV